MIVPPLSSTGLYTSAGMSGEWTHSQPWRTRKTSVWDRTRSDPHPANMSMWATHSLACFCGETVGEISLFWQQGALPKKKTSSSNLPVWHDVSSELLTGVLNVEWKSTLAAGQQWWSESKAAAAAASVRADPGSVNRSVGESREAELSPHTHTHVRTLSVSLCLYVCAFSVAARPVCLVYGQSTSHRSVNLHQHLTYSLSVQDCSETKNLKTEHILLKQNPDSHIFILNQPALCTCKSTDSSSWSSKLNLTEVLTETHFKTDTNSKY